MIGATDTEDYNLEWGFQLIAAYILVTEYYLGWAPGTSAIPPANNCSPVWITPVNDNTIVQVDFSPVNGTYDLTATLDRLDSYRVYDPDINNTGMQYRFQWSHSSCLGRSQFESEWRRLCGYQSQYGSGIYCGSIDRREVLILF